MNKPMTEMLRNELKQMVERLNAIDFLTEKQKEEIEQISWEMYDDVIESTKVFQNFVTSFLQPMLDKKDMQINKALLAHLPKSILLEGEVLKVTPDRTGIELFKDPVKDLKLTGNEIEKFNAYTSYDRAFKEKYNQQNEVIKKHVQPIIDSGDKAKLKKLFYCLPECPIKFTVMIAFQD